MENFQKVLKRYDYRINSDAIAKKPASPRDGARLLVFSRKDGEIKFDVFRNLAKYIPKNSVLVFNETKVIPARVALRKETGGRVIILYIGKERGMLKIMADRKLNVGQRLFLNAKLFFAVERQEKKFYFLTPSFSAEKIPDVLKKFGLTPLPPYIKHSPLSEKERREKYQTVFAKKDGSVAAPTASLHFTKRLLRTLKKAGIALQFVTLHVNLGTFAPLTEENILTGKLHEEFYEIPPKTMKFLKKAKQQKRPIIATGTTVVRTLESAAISEKPRGTTGLFIREGYRFKFVDGIITNFHVPRSSLLMLVSAFASRKKILELYQIAQEKDFRFFSFGDGMLLI